MKILIMGAGVIGVTTAYQLLKDGHEVVAETGVTTTASTAACSTSTAPRPIVLDGDAVEKVATDTGEFSADAYVPALETLGRLLAPDHPRAKRQVEA